MVCPACGTDEPAQSIDLIKNAFRDVTVDVCPRCGFVYDREICEAASGRKFPVYVETKARPRECTLDDVPEECPMQDEGVPDCEMVEDGRLLYRCNHYKLKEIKHVDGGSLRVPDS